MEHDEDCIPDHQARWVKNKYDVLFAVSWHLVYFHKHKFKDGVEFSNDMAVIMRDATRNPMDGD